MSVDDVVKLIQQYGHGTLLSKSDLADTFHHILVRIDQWTLLRSSFQSMDNSGQHVNQIYLSTLLPFGLCSNPAIFTDSVHVTKLTMMKRGVTECEHYLDDFITVSPPNSELCSSSLDVMLNNHQTWALR